MNTKENKTINIMENKVVKSITLLIVTICMITSSFTFSQNFKMFDTAYANTNYEMPDFIRVSLSSNFSNKSKLNFLNEKIILGYDASDFTADAEFTCSKGFYLELNTSNRYISEDTYTSYSEVKEIIGDSNDYIPIFFGENNFKIATKDGRSASDIANVSYSNRKSIVLISGDYKELAVFEGTDYPLFMSGDNEEIPLMKLSSSKHYRGYIQIINGTSGITAVNHVLFDEYLYGVITSEMPSSWHIEALKAQAIVARTFAYKKILAERYTYYDVVDTTSDQVYGGYNNETESSRASADATSREVVVYVGADEAYNGKLIDAFFSSCDGGVTEESQNVWSTALPYCKSKIDPYEEKNKYYGWTSRFTIEDLNNAMKSRGENIGTVTGCTVVTASESGRVIKFNVIGTAGTYTVTKDSIRSFFTNYMPDKINSTNFELYSGSSPEYTETITKNQAYVANSSSSVQKLFENIFMINSDGTSSNVIQKNVYAINGDGVVKELPITSVVKTEKTDVALNKGEYLIVGNGYGHGVGMSQYGAKGMADKGYNYKEIINFYYTDVDIIYIR